MASCCFYQAASPGHTVICTTPGLPSALTVRLEYEAIPLALALIVGAGRHYPDHAATEPRRLGFGFVQVDPTTDQRLSVGIRDFPPARAIRLAFEADHVLVLATLVAAEEVNSFCHVAAPHLGGYSLAMPDKLDALLERLKAHQRTLILAMAEHDGLPAQSAIRQVAELENVIAAVEAVAAEEAAKPRKSAP